MGKWLENTRVLKKKHEGKRKEESRKCRDQAWEEQGLEHLSVKRLKLYLVGVQGNPPTNKLGPQIPPPQKASLSLGNTLPIKKNCFLVDQPLLSLFYHEPHSFQNIDECIQKINLIISAIYIVVWLIDLSNPFIETFVWVFHNSSLELEVFLFINKILYLSINKNKNKVLEYIWPILIDF